VAPALRARLSYPPIFFVSNGLWTGAQPMSYGYQWLRCATTELSSCTPIDGATDDTYVPLPEDAGFRLRATVTASNGGGTGSATSAATPPV
jgi:hypothetical protein